MHKSPRLPLCHHIKTNGTRCKTPALRGERFCYFHHRTIGRGARQAILQSPLPLLEDANAIQVAIYRIVVAILDGSLEPKRANAILYALQTAAVNIKRTRLEPFSEDVVTEIEQNEPVERPEPPRRTPAKQADIARPLKPTRPATHDDVTAFLNKLLPAAVKPEPKEDGPRTRAQRAISGPS